MNLDFQNKILLEQVRAIESAQSDAILVPEVHSEKHFLNWLQCRATAMIQLNNWATAIHHGPLLYQRFTWFLAGLTLFLGVLSTQTLLSSSGPTLNVFWLLGALLGLNGGSLLLWLVFTLALRSSNPGVLANAIHSGLNWLLPTKNKPSTVQVATRAWLETIVTPPLHTWRLSYLSHLAWSAYLLGSIVGLLLMFTTRQFDFIWQSTLLDANAFAAITGTLGAPLELLGLTVPSTTVTEATPVIRQHWAIFVLCCLILYGLIPRLIALLATLGLDKRAQKNWPLDLSLPYYLKLQGLFWAEAPASEILDPDPSPTAEVTVQAEFRSTSPPEHALWVGLELTDSWIAKLPSATLFQVSDQASLQQTMAEIDAQSHPLVIAVTSQKGPDRGLQRMLKQLSRPDCWLAILDSAQPPDAKCFDWLQTGIAAGINPHNITRVAVTL